METLEYRLPMKTDLPARPVTRSIMRGAKQHCPSCGRGSLFSRYLKVVDSCGKCGEELHYHRADDAPPYLTIFVVGHIVVPLLLMMEVAIRPAIWVHMALWLPLSVILSLVLLPVIKGGVVGLQWALYMHGFDPGQREAEAVPAEPS